MASVIKPVLANDVGAVKAALAQGADPDERDDDGRSAIIHAAIGNRIEIARLLLASGADINCQDYLGNSALHYAAQEHSAEMASLLIGYGAAIDIEDNHGNTPLGKAVFNSQGRGQLITILLKAGANRFHHNKHGKTPVDLAKTIGNYDVEQFFGE